MDPGTPLAIVSLAIQVTKGLIAYYALWRDTEQNIEEIEKSILWTENLFTQLAITLQKQDLPGDVVSLIWLTVKGCEGNILKLQSLLENIRKDGTPKRLHAMLRTANQKILYMFHSKTIKALSTTLSDLKNDLKLAVSLLSLKTSAENLEELRSFQKNLESLTLSFDQSTFQQKSRLDDKELRDRYLEIIRWLAPPNVANAHHTALEKRQDGTGHWLLLGERFATWRTCDASSLWLHGDVGCGKTVLCASIIEDISTRCYSRSVPDDVIYFYFAFDDTQRQNLSGVLKSTLSQLCPKDAVLPQISELFKKCSPDPPSPRELQMTLIAILQGLCTATPTRQKSIPSVGSSRQSQESKHTFLVLDGLDEIPYGSQREAVLRFLQYLSGLRLPRLHILATSRLERDIESSFDTHFGWQSLRISRFDVQIDINIFITSQIEQSPKLQSQPNSIKDAIKKRLVREADGMFRWSALQMEVLKSKRVLRGRDILNILSALPSDLDATYERILVSIDPSFVNEAIFALQWLSCASRPMFIEELVEACIVRPDEADAVDNDHRFSPLDILEILPGMVSIETGTAEFDISSRRSHTITLSHFSVQEYLFSDRIQDGPANRFGINLEDAHYHVTRSCLAYVLHCQSLDEVHYNYSHPLGVYAHSRWPLHLSRGPDNKAHELCSQIIELFRHPKTCLRWVDGTAIERSSFVEKRKIFMLEIPLYAHTRHDWPLHYLLCHSIASKNTDLVRLLLASGLHPHPSDATGYPLRLAVHAGDLSILRLLLLNGAYEEGVLVIALQAKREDISKALLASGARAGGAELLVAAKQASSALFNSLVSTGSTLSTVDFVKVLDAALGRQNQDGATTILRAVLQHQLKLNDCPNPGQHGSSSDSEGDPFLDTILAAIIRFNSTRMITFMLQFLSRPELDMLNTEALFLQSVIEGSQNATKLLRVCPWISVSMEARRLATDWESVGVYDKNTAAIVTMHDENISTNTAMSTNIVKTTSVLNWWFLRTFEPEVVDRCLQDWLVYHTAALSGKPLSQTACGSPCQTLWRPWSSCNTIRTYIILSGPYSSFLKQRYSVQTATELELLKLHFESQSLSTTKLLRTHLEARSLSPPPEASKSGSQSHNIFQKPPWSEFLVPLFERDAPGLEPLSTLADNHFNYKLIGAHSATASSLTTPTWWTYLTQYLGRSLHSPGQYLLGESGHSGMQLARVSPTARHVALHIGLEWLGDNQTRLEESQGRDFAYHVVVIHGIFDDSDVIDAYPEPHPMHPPFATVYRTILTIDLICELEEDLSRWCDFALDAIYANGFRSIFPSGGISYDTPMDQLSLCVDVDEWHDTDIPQACKDYLGIIWKTQEAGWALSWHDLPRRQLLQTSAGQTSEITTMVSQCYDQVYESLLGDAFEPGSRSRSNTFEVAGFGPHSSFPMLKLKLEVKSLQASQCGAIIRVREET